MKCPYKAYRCTWRGEYETIVYALTASKARSRYYYTSGLDESYTFGEVIATITAHRAKQWDGHAPDELNEEIGYPNWKYQYDFRICDPCRVHGKVGWIIGRGCSGTYAVGLDDKIVSNYHPRDVKPFKVVE
jgi:hypothetical protein